MIAPKKPLKIQWVLSRVFRSKQEMKPRPTQI